MEDSALLRQYLRDRSDEAFATLVRRHINLVYSVALRHIGNPQNAEEITQAVFIILAKKAAQLRHDKALSSWLFRTTRLTAANFIRSESRRRDREQEAYMQSVLNEPEDDLWLKLAPLLDDAVSNLREKDRQAILLRFYEGKNLREVGVALRTGEPAAEKRVSRALDKLRKFFAKRGVSSTTAIIAGTISTHSVQPAPEMLAHSVSAAAVAKVAAASASTPALIKGALKVMAWTKAKTATMVFVGALLAVGTTTITVREIQKHRPYPWEVRQFNLNLLDQVPPQVRIVPAKFPPGGMGMNANGKFMGIGQPLKNIFPHAYRVNWSRTVFETPLPSGNYDFIANLPNGSAEAMQREIERKFSLKTKREMRDTDALTLTLRTAEAPGLKPTTSQALQLDEGDDHFTATSCSISDLCGFLESNFQVPVTDETGLTQRFDIHFEWKRNDPQNLKQALLDQLGLELLATNTPIEMLVVEKAR